MMADSLPARSWASALWRGSPRLPTTAQGAELCILVAFVGLRLTDLVQLLVSTPVGLRRATAPGLDVALVSGYVLESVAVMVIVIRARRFLSTRIAALDAAVGLAILACQPLFTSSADRVGTWTAWGYAVTVGTAFAAGIGFPRRWQTLSVATVLAATYVAVSLPAAGSATLSTVLSNAVGYFGFALFPRALAAYLRRLAGAADDARAEAARAGQQAERERQRWLLHDHETLMRMMADPELDPVMATMVRKQAAAGANRVRSFLNAAEHDDDGSHAARVPTRLPALVSAVALDNADLPIDASVELAAGVELDAATASVLFDALTTLLYNVRRHAAATSVIIHADARAAEWEVSVNDDGAGFDVDSTSFGFGLRDQVIRRLAGVGARVSVESAPGEGTRVTVRGPIPGAR